MATPHAPAVFDARLEILPWGRNAYTVIKVPDGLAQWARREQTRRVAGTIENVAVNLGLNRADVIPDTFMYAGESLQKRLGVRAGDVVRCVLEPADPDDVPLPDDVREALESTGRLAAFERRPATERRRLLAPIDDVVRPATRARRIAKLVSDLPPDG